MKKLNMLSCILLALLLALPLLLQGTPASATELNYLHLYDADELYLFETLADHAPKKHVESPGVFYVKAYHWDDKYLMAKIGKYPLKDLPFNAYEDWWVWLMLKVDGEARYTSVYRSHKHSFVDGTCQTCGFMLPKVVDLTAEVVQGGVQLRWKLAGGAVDYFEIWRASSDYDDYHFHQAVADNMFLDTKVEKGKLYAYSVRAVVLDPDDNTIEYHGAHSNVAAAAIIDAPTGLMVGLGPGRKEVRVLWDAMDGVGGYQLMRGKFTKPGETGTATEQVYQGDASIYSDTDIKPGDNLVYRVRSFVYFDDLPSPGLLSDHLHISISTGIKGDANNDGKVGVLDLISLMEYLVKGTRCPSMDNADADSSGGDPNAQDFAWIVDKLVGK